MRFSIIIPTYNRCEILTECLIALSNQEYDKSQYEIIVVDDGSYDETSSVVEDMVRAGTVQITYLYQHNQGQGVARNRGVANAVGEVVVFIGDDIIATPQFLKEYDLMHKLHPEETAAVLGFVTWHQKLTITPLMHFMERGGAVLGMCGGHQFAYDMLRAKQTADFRFFYTANVSLKRSLISKFKFNPRLSGYGWEDIELGYRLQSKAAMTLYYAPKVIGYHHHPITDKAFATRMRSIGESIHTLHHTYPDIGLFPSPRKLKVFRILSAPFVLSVLKHIWMDLYFYALSKKYFLEGFDRAHATIAHK